MTDSHTFSGRFNGVRRRWNVPDLWRAARHLPVEPILISSLAEISDTWISHIHTPDHPDVAPEWGRIHAANLSYPILLHPCGWVMDGYHRLAKAILGGRITLLGQRFMEETLPPERAKV